MIFGWIFKRENHPKYEIVAKDSWYKQRKNTKRERERERERVEKIDVTGIRVLET